MCFSMGSCASGRAWIIGIAALLLALVGAIARAEEPQHRLGAERSTFTVTKRVVARFLLPKGADVDDLQWSPDGKRLAVARAHGEVVLLPSWRTFPASSHQGAFGSVQLRWSPEGQQLAIVNDLLEAVKLKTGQREVVGVHFLCAAWLPDLRRLEAPDPTAGLLGVKSFPPASTVTVIARPWVNDRAGEKYLYSPLLLNTRGVCSALSSDGKVLVTRQPQVAEYGSGDTTSIIVWRLRLRDGHVLWHRTVPIRLPPDYDNDRVVWSESQQAAAVSFAGATDGRSARNLHVVTRQHILRYYPERLEMPKWLLSDPVWLGSSVVFAESGYGRRGDSIVSFEAFSGMRKVLFRGAEAYRGPAVSPDSKKFAYAQMKGGRWEVLVVAVDSRGSAKQLRSHRQR
jgi:dipeptidyl aminopeptidase/acylaminoacyl peptidase